MKAWVQITSGRGPDECCWAVARFLKVFSDEVEKAGYRIDLLEAIEGNHPHSMKSVLLTFEGIKIEPFLETWEGTIQWIGQSPFRPNHRRKNWFIGVNVFYPAEERLPLASNEIKYESMRAAGPGGQHVNKTNSAIRAIHLPTGIAATAQEERSQLMNKKLATAKLLKILSGNVEKKRQNFHQAIWNQHNCLERGNPTRVYAGTSMVRQKISL